MKHEQITWRVLNEMKKTPTFNRYCSLISCCEECNPRVRMICKVKKKLTDIQEMIIRNELNNRPG